MKNKDPLFTRHGREVILAPLSGVSDLPFRMICREFGARLCFFEMLDVHSLLNGQPRALRMLKTHKSDRPTAVQLLGRDPAMVCEAASMLSDIVKPPFIDINAACPARKVIKKKAGAYLLKDTDALAAVLERLSSSAGVPVTVKIRTAYGRRSVEETARIAKLCEASGAGAIFIHGRTVAQGYSGGADYEAIRKAREAVGIPVIASGDITSPVMAAGMFEKTGCHGVLVARGAMGNPWIFNNIKIYLENGRFDASPSLEEKKSVLRRHLSYVVKHKEMHPRDKLGYMCKITMWYLKGIGGARRLRDKLGKVRDNEGLQSMIDNA